MKSISEDDFGVLRPCQQYLSHIETMKEWKWKALCNGGPRWILLQQDSLDEFCPNRIQTWNLAILNMQGQPLCFPNISKPIRLSNVEKKKVQSENVNQLIQSILSKNCSWLHFEIFSYFSQKVRFGIPCKLYPKERICKSYFGQKLDKI